ncbi:MAG: hypothetical protein ALECFALPRED_008475 [Alectoria fallacina]|uniref:Methyltransferase domain-containing protein n=1 Tax=Alectoria fallacina TaxID=1903189 RepID=A0A8H3PH36_9LECA|nr:MAG: hypothetical protein ALECFALPRED_008475 [Alectoria fallacina]
MPVECPLPVSPDFGNAEAYVESLLSFVTSSELFQTLCGGVHILDFLTKEPDLYSTALPQDWRVWLQLHDVPAILDLLMKEDGDLLDFLKSSIDTLSAEKKGTNSTWRSGPCPPTSLLEYIQAIRSYALNRDFRPLDASTAPSPAGSGLLPRHVAVGMNPKKIHEVENFVKYINGLTAEIDTTDHHKITHIVDFGSGQNYLGRALASSPYNKQVIALESKKLNIKGAKVMDITAGLAEKEKILRNKKQYRMGLRSPNPDPDASQLGNVQLNSSSLAPVNGKSHGSFNQANPDESKGRVQYIESFIQDGDLSKVVHQTKCAPTAPHVITNSDPQLMVISLHSCGNLLHHGLRSLILNPSVKAVAMVGCCYNLMTERLGPPTYKLPSLRSFNLRLDATSSTYDPHGFPMSERLATYQHHHGQGIRLNITARMMAVQAPENWTATDCESFFTRHFYRALLQRILLDRGVVDKPTEDGDIASGSPRGWTGAGPALTIGSLRKASYISFIVYVRGAIAKLADDQERGAEIQRRMEGLTDEDISHYDQKFREKKKELSIIWSLMAFSASVVESIIVVDRWLYLKEQAEVRNCWVETVFDYKQSPRNLVVVGIKE